ncbi:hypothetical protein F1880_004642 [Penicillium rolfsii]|nr:hypothetical protein F1880_004642 [Penicillium rolfsii]
MILVVLVTAQSSAGFPSSGGSGSGSGGGFPSSGGSGSGSGGGFPSSGGSGSGSGGGFPSSGGSGSGGVCPAVRETAQNQSPIAGKQYSCPTNNGQLYESSDGHHFYMQCCTDIPGFVPIFGLTATDFGACMDACAQEPSGRCKSVGFDSNPSPGDTENCVFFDRGDFRTLAHPKYHYAFLAEAPYADHPDDDIKLCTTECPGSNNQVYKTPFGKTMRMVCGKRHGVEAAIENVESWENCMDLCGKLVPCQSVDYHRRTKRCYFGDHAGEPTIDAPGFSAAYSMGCDGACCSYPKP